VSTTPAGYSGTPLAKKLGIKVGSLVLAVNPPAHYLELVAPLPAGVVLASRLTGRTDIVHVFSTRRADLAARLRSLVRTMRAGAAIWVSWPKKSAGVPTDITEDVIREVALPLGLVDIKVCAVDGTWSGLKLVIRKENRTSR
jgi:hypothetical protein